MQVRTSSNSSGYRQRDWLSMGEDEGVLSARVSSRIRIGLAEVTFPPPVKSATRQMRPQAWSPVTGGGCQALRDGVAEGGIGGFGGGESPRLAVAGRCRG
jgi:hypothetical protein